jgi:hypothetical protein
MVDVARLPLTDRMDLFSATARLIEEEFKRLMFDVEDV